MTRSLQQFIDERESHQRRIVVVNGAEVDDEVTEIVDYFDRFDLETRRVTIDGLPESFLVLTDGDAYLGSVGIAELHAYLFEAFDQNSFRDLDPSAKRNPSVEGFLTHLDGNVYSLFGEGKVAMGCVSQLLETRAWRRGAGELHTGFQTFRALRDDPSVWTRYRKIADCGVDTTVYGRPEWTPETWNGVNAYADETGEHVADYWFVVYRGPDDQDDGALLARETDPGRYTGFWTFDSETVGALVETLVADYQPSLSALGDAAPS
ncbi:hypothetical protein ACFR97_04165 [Haloplanus litoreus]|uniref:Diguanylate Cyclase and Two-component system sensory domain-containing protein n=1 Tax=Haloplanus litoreus TaxID=767515 RepID=A0ABD6A009_9EURY